MKCSYITKPPLLLGQGFAAGGIRKQIIRISQGLWRILWQTIVPFNPSPEPPAPPPSPAFTPSPEQMEQCQKLYDEVEETRNDLEQKARATFSVISFSTPLLASILVFVFSHSTPSTLARYVAIALALMSLSFLFLSFLSISRAVSVQMRERLFLGAIIDFDQNNIRKYDAAFHMQGLLYCTSVNQAMNDHIAQFVKGAHILTAIAILSFVLAVIPAAVAFSSLAPSATKTEIMGAVQISPESLLPLQNELAKLESEIAALRATNTVSSETVDRLNERVFSLESKVSQQKAITPARPGSGTKK